MRSFLSFLFTICILVSSSAFTSDDGVEITHHKDFILILNKSGDSAWQIDAETGKKVAQYPTGHAPHEVAISPNRSKAAITNYGTQTAGHTLTIIDLKKQEIEKTIDISPYSRPHGIQWFSGGNQVIVSVEEQQSVIVVDVVSGTVIKSIKTNRAVSHMVQLSSDEQRVFVPNIGSGSVSVLNISDGELVKTIKTGDGAEGITLANNGSEVWITNRSSDTISIIDTNTLTVVKNLQSSSFPIRAKVSPNGKWVAVSNARSSDVSIFDASSKELIKKVSTLTDGIDEGVPIGLIFSSDSSRLYVANSEADHIVVIDTDRWTVVDTFETGNTPDGIAYFSLQ